MRVPVMKVLISALEATPNQVIANECSPIRMIKGIIIIDVSALEYHAKSRAEF